MNILQYIKNKTSQIYNYLLAQPIISESAICKLGDKLKSLNEAPDNQQFINDLVSNIDNATNATIVKTALLLQLKYMEQANAHDGRFKHKEIAYLKLSHAVIKNLLKINDIVGIQPTSDDSNVNDTCFLLQKKGSSFEFILEIIKVPTQSKELLVEYPLDIILAFNEHHSPDITADRINKLATIISYNIIKDVFKDLINIARHNTTFVNYRKNDTIRQHAKYVMSVINDHVSVINDHVYKVSENTQRGYANFIVCNTVALPFLQQYITQDTESGLKFELIPVWNYQYPIHVANITHDDTIVYTVYSYNFQYRSTFDVFLIGYKGVASTDAGYVLCPHMNLDEPGNSKIHYSAYMDTATIESRNSKNYYRLVRAERYHNE